MGGEHTVRCTGDVMQNDTPETYMILLTSDIPINPVKTNWKVTDSG